MNKRVLFKNIASLSIVQIANYILPLISIPIISRIIGPENFGVINYAAAFIAYFNVFISYGFDLTATRRIAQDPTNSKLRNKVFSEVFSAQTFLFVTSILLFIGCLYFFDPLRKELTVALFSFLFCLGTLFTQNWLFLAMQDLPKVALFDFSGKLLFTIVVILVVREKADYIWQPLVASIIQIIVAIISFVWAIKKYKLQFFKISYSRLFLLLKNEFAVFVSLVVINIYTTTNIIILGFFQNSEKVGFYTAGQKLIVVATSVVSLPLSHAFFPFIAKSLSENYEKGIQVVQKLIPLVILFTGGIGLGILLLGPWAIELFYGREFAPSALVFQLLAFIPMLISIGSILGIQLMLNLQMDRMFFRITAVTAIISIFGNLLLIDGFGYIGVAINWVLTELFIDVGMYWVLRRNNINPIDFKQFHPELIRLQFEPVLKRIIYLFKKS